MKLSGSMNRNEIMPKEPKLNKEQQKRLDSIVQKHFDYIDEFYDKKDPPPQKTQADHRKPRQDIFLPEEKKPKRSKYRPGICEKPGCGVTFEKKSGIQKHCEKHLKSAKYVPVAERDKNGSES
jgi:hypothetical protein